MSEYQDINEINNDSNDYILLAQGTLKRAIVWRISRFLAYLIVFLWAINTFGQPKTGYITREKAGIPRGVWRADGYESVSIVHGGSTFTQIIATVIALVILHLLIKWIYRSFIFQWIYKLPYSLENVVYIKKAVK